MSREKEKVQNPYWKGAPYNCPYFYRGWDYASRCELYDTCSTTYGFYPSCDIYEGIYGPQKVNKVEARAIEINIKQEQEKEGKREDD
jgi:hypothetical protein